MATLTGRRDGASTRGRSRRAASPFSAKKKSQSEARVLVHRRHRALVLCRRMPSIPSRRMPSIRLSRSFKMARRRRRRRRLICIQVCERKANPFAAVDADWSTSRWKVAAGDWLEQWGVVGGWGGVLTFLGLRRSATLTPSAETSTITRFFLMPLALNSYCKRHKIQIKNGKNGALLGFLFTEFHSVVENGVFSTTSEIYRVDMVFYWVLLVFFYKVWAWYQRMFLCYGPWEINIGFSWVGLDLVAFYWVLPGFTGFYSVL